MKINIKLISADLFICVNAVLRIRQELDHSKGWIGSGIISNGFVITNNKRFPQMVFHVL